MNSYQRIIKDCFWDMDMSDGEIGSILKNDDFRKKAFLFEKILINSTRLFIDLKIFQPKELEKLFNDYQIPIFNSDYIFLRKNLAEVYFFNKPLLIAELKWIA